MRRNRFLHGLTRLNQHLLNDRQILLERHHRRCLNASPPLSQWRDLTRQSNKKLLRKFSAPKTTTKCSASKKMLAMLNLKRPIKRSVWRCIRIKTQLLMQMKRLKKSMPRCHVFQIQQSDASIIRLGMRTDLNKESPMVGVNAAITASNEETLEILTMKISSPQKTSSTLCFSAINPSGMGLCARNNSSNDADNVAKMKMERMLAKFSANSCPWFFSFSWHWPRQC